MSWSVVKGDMRQLLPILARESVDSIVCDPPYGLSKEPDVVEVLEHWIRGDDYVHKGGGFMGKGWDSFVPGPSYWKACYDALKPGGHLIAFGGTRTYDLLVIAIRMAGFEIRDQLAWMYGTGFPKSMDVSKAIDKAARGVPQGGADPTSPNHGRFKTMMTEGSRGDGDAGQGYGGGPGAFMAEAGVKVERELVEEAQQWEGWGTALKPAFEPIVLARKPLGEKTVAANVLANGTGALNIDATRIATDDSLGGGAEKDIQSDKPEGWDRPWRNDPDAQAAHAARIRENVAKAEQLGRWPANVVLSHTEDCKLIGKTVRKGDNRETGAVRRPSGFGDVGAENGDSEPNAKVYGDAEVEIWSCADDCPVFLLDQQSGTLKSGVVKPHHRNHGKVDTTVYGAYGGDISIVGYGDTGGASRFFYTAKVSKAERNAGLPEGMTNKHPTVKPIELMRWLVRLVTPFGGIVFDPFCGSGSTGCAAAMEGFSFVGIDLDEEDTNVEVAQYRIAHWEQQKEERSEQLRKMHEGRYAKS